MKADLEKNGFFTMDAIITPWVAECLAGRAERYGTFYARQTEATMGGWSNYHVIDGHSVNRDFQELVELYGTLKLSLEEMLSREILLSPYEKSSINIKIYPDGNGSQGWHYDTQPLTALLYLTAGSPTEIVDKGGETVFVEPQPGRLLVMDGRECLHRVVLNNSFNSSRISVPFNYYYPGDTDRPEGIDDIIYGETVINRRAA